MVEKTDWLEEEIDFVKEKIKGNLQVFYDKVPAAASKGLVYPAEDNMDWTASFWVGMLFLMKEVTGSNEYDDVIRRQMESFKERMNKKIALDTHDIGFLYTLSAIADFKVNHSKAAEKLAVDAADALMTRYSEKAHIIQAWGDLENPKEKGRMIIDCLMNLSLLYFASDVTGNHKYKEAAYLHAKNTQKYIVRENYTTFHTYFFNTETGEALRGETFQGYSNDSCWARGQAWGIYGFTLSYIHTGDKSFLDTAIHLANYFISQLPEDSVCYWDLIFNDGSGEERDSSSAAIAACGLLELARQLPITNEKRKIYESTALKMIRALHENYTTRNYPDSNGILLHGVYMHNQNVGVDECMIWGDYYYLEALVRLTRSWYRYW